MKVYGNSGIVIDISTTKFNNTLTFLNKINNDYLILKILEKHGRQGLNALVQATPIRTGETVASWDYKVAKENDGYSITWLNTNMNKNLSIVALIVLGHGTGTGGYIPPNDFVTPAIRPILEKIIGEAWEEVSEVT